MMAFRGVRSSWLMVARNWLLCRLASSSSRPFASSSRNRRAFWMASADWPAKVCSSATTSGGNAPGVLRLTPRPPSDAGPRAERARQQRRGSRRAAPRSRSGPLAGRRRPGCPAPGPARGVAAARPRLPPSRQAQRRGSPRSSAPRGAGRSPAGANASAGVVVLEDGAAVGAGEARGVRDDAGEHLVQVERGGDRLASPRPAPSAGPPSASAALRSCSSWNSRAFSMAITAWSAKVSSSAICWSLNGRAGSAALERPATPIGRALAQQRDAPAWCGPRCRPAALGSAHSGSAARSGTCIDRAVGACDRPADRRRPARRVGARARRAAAPAAASHRREPLGASDAGRRPRRGRSARGRRRTGAPRSRRSCPAPRCRSVGEPAMTRSTSAVAVCCSSASVSVAVALLQLGEQAGVLDGDHGLVGEGLQQRDLPLGEGAHLPRGAGRSRRSAAPCRSSGTASTVRTPSARARRRRQVLDSGTRGQVGDVHDRAVRDRAAGGRRHVPGPADRPAARSPAAWPAAVGGRARRRRGRRRPRRGRSAPRSVPHRRAALSAMVSSTCCRSVGARLIAASTSRGRRLLLQGLGERAVALLQLLEQPGVLDGDHGLVGEGLQQRDLLLGEGPRLRRRIA